MPHLLKHLAASSSHSERTFSRIDQARDQRTLIPARVVVNGMNVCGQSNPFAMAGRGATNPFATAKRGETAASDAIPGSAWAVAPQHNYHSDTKDDITCTAGRAAPNHGSVPKRPLFALCNEFPAPDEQRRLEMPKPGAGKKNVLNPADVFRGRRERPSYPGAAGLPNAFSGAPTGNAESVDEAEIRRELTFLFEQLGQVQNKYFDYLKSSLSSAEGSTDLRLIYQAFKKLRKQYKNAGATQAEICEIGYKRCRYFWFLNKRAEVMEKEYQKLYPYGEPGASKAKSISLGAGTGIGFGLNFSGKEFGATAPVSFGISKEKSYSQDDEGFFYPNPQSHAVSLSGGVSSGFKLSEDVDLSLGATGSARYFRQKGYEYGDVKDYIKHKGFVNVKCEPVGLEARIACIFKNKLTRKDFINSNLEAIGAGDRVKALLAGKDLSNMQSTPLPQRTMGAPYVLNGVSVDVSAQANAIANIHLGPITVNQGLGARVTQELRYIDLEARVKYNLIDYLKKKRSAVAKNVFGGVACASIFSGKLQEKIKTFNYGQDFSLNDLSSDLKEYCSIVRKYDWSKSYLYANKFDRAKLRKEKNGIEERWGAIGRDQFLQHIWFALGSLYERADTEGVILDPDGLADLIKDLESPNMAYKYEKIQNVVYANDIVPLTIRDIRSELNVSLAQFKGKFELLHRKRVHPHVLREGEYMDLIVTGEANVSIASIFGSDEFKTVLDQFTQASNLQLPSDFLVTPDIGVSGNISYRVRFFKPKYSEDEEYGGQKWRHQLTRITTGTTVGVNLSMSSPVVGVSVSGSAGYQSQATKVRSENISHDDMTYLVLRCLRFYRNSELDNITIGKDVQNKEWIAFYIAHKADIHSIWKNMSNKKHPIYKEMNFLVNNYGDNAQWEAFLSSLDGRRGQINDANEDAIQKQFCKLVASFDKKMMDAHRSRWKSEDFKPSIQSKKWVT